MNVKYRLLDLFCKAGGASAGYELAGFHVTGVDIQPQERYPCEFIQADAMEVLRDTAFLNNFDVVAASPPCQCYSVTKHLSSGKHPDLVEPVRRLLVAWGGPYVIENVVGAPLVFPVRLCGSSFGLDVRRHRLFESNMYLRRSKCRHGWQTSRFPHKDTRPGRADKLSHVVQVCGGGNSKRTTSLRRTICVSGQDEAGSGVDEWRRAMDITWMNRDELSQAIPPAYTKFLGRQIIQILDVARATGVRFNVAFSSAFNLPGNSERSL